MTLTKKRVLRSIGFLVLLGIVIIKCGFWLRPISLSADSFPNFYEHSDNSIDAVFMGSSAMYRFWIPAAAYEEEGFTSALLTSAAQDLNLVPYLIDEVMKTQDPDVFVVELRRIIRDEISRIDGKNGAEQVDYYTDEMVSGMDLSDNKINVMRNLQGLSESEIAERLIPVLHYHDRIYDSSLLSLGSRILNDGVFRTNRLQLSKVKPCKFKLYDEADYPDINLPEENLQILDQIIEKAAQYGKEVLFVSTPYVTSARGQKLRVDLNHYLDEKGYLYLDMASVPDEIGLDFGTDFYNSTHTNFVGAKKVTAYLGKYMSEHYDFNTQLTPKQEKYWNSYLGKWHKREEKLTEEWQKNVKRAAKKK